MNSKQAKEIPLQDFFSKIGFKPATSKGHLLWYFSPFRDERTPSFKVDTSKNTWYDFALGKGGTIIDFTIEKYNRDISGSLKIIEDICGRVNQLQFNTIAKSKPKNKDTSESNQILEVLPLKHIALINYITKVRKINESIAKEFCVEVWYKVKETKYFTIGFKNDSGGYETRNSFFPRSFAPKNITTFEGKNRDLVIIFEGFINFLSFLTKHRINSLEYSFIILNSAHMKEEAIKKINEIKPKLLHFYLDNDKTGENTKSEIIKKTGVKSISMNEEYIEYNDYNDFIRGFKKTNQ